MPNGQEEADTNIAYTSRIISLAIHSKELEERFTTRHRVDDDAMMEYVRTIRKYRRLSDMPGDLRKDVLALAGVE